MAPISSNVTVPRLMADRPSDLDALRRRVELVDRARAALDLATSEEEAIRTATAAVAEMVPGRSIDIVLGGEECVALRRHGPTVSPSSDHFDACPHLRGRPSVVSGLCVPLSFSEEILGALQWEGHPGEVPDRITRGAIDVVAHLLALRLALIRSDLGAEDPRTDPLTGTLNRRSTGHGIRRLIHDLVPFSLAVCDLDEFDAYNETHGHDAGDRALRLFAETITATVRPGDIVGRTSGDAFTVVFPSTSALDAAQALERVREVLVLALTGGELPAFTASFGVADSNQGDSVDAITETAELAAILAKTSGANRVVVAGEETTGPARRDIASDQDGHGL
jgi:diguanylate cyclase (GGDEF)-like protein